MIKKLTCISLLLLLQQLSVFSETESRIVTLGVMPTETVCKLGAAAQLVGFDQSSAQFMRYQPSASLLNYHRTTSSESILSLKPSHVILTDAAGPPTAIEQIKNSGIPFLLLPEPREWSEVLGGIRKLGSFISQKEKAEALVTQLEQQKAAVDLQSSAAQDSGIKPPRVLFVMSSGSSGTLLCAGEASGADAVIRMAGGTNAATGFKGYKPISTEALIGLKPDIVLYPGKGGHAPSAFGKSLNEHPGLKQSPAAQQEKFYKVDLTATLGFGPSIGEAMTALVNWFYPVDQPQMAQRSEQQ